MMYWSTLCSRSARGPCSLPNINRSQKGCCSGTLTTSFFCACGVSCRVRAERAKPYASLAKPASDSPADLSEGPCGSPAPGATRELGVVAMLLSLIDIRLGGRVVNTHESSLFTEVRGRQILRTSPLRGSEKFCVRKVAVQHSDALNGTTCYAASTHREGATRGGVEAQNFVPQQAWAPGDVGSQWCNRLPLTR